MKKAFYILILFILSCSICGVGGYFYGRKSVVVPIYQESDTMRILEKRLASVRDSLKVKTEAYSALLRRGDSITTIYDTVLVKVGQLSPSEAVEVFSKRTGCTATLNEDSTANVPPMGIRNANVLFTRLDYELAMNPIQIGQIENLSSRLDDCMLIDSIQGERIGVLISESLAKDKVIAKQDGKIKLQKVVISCISAVFGVAIVIVSIF